MNTILYEVIDSNVNDHIVGTFENIDDAIIFLKALFSEYYNEKELSYTIRKVE